MTRPRTPTRKNQHGLVVGHLLGEYSLARAYWLHTVFLGWGLAAAFGYVLGGIGASHPVRYVSMAMLAYVPVAFLVWAWSTFGASASAFKNLLRGDGRLWAVAALLSLCLGSFGVLKELLTLKPFLRAHWAVAQGEQPGEPFTVKLVDGGRVVDFSGPINEGAAAALERVIAPAPKVTTVRLESPGGWMREGERMAAVVKRFGLSTTVATQCMSACTIVLLAGLDRTAGQGAMVGFHRGRAIGRTKDNEGRPDREEMEIYLRAGVDKDFVKRIVSTPHEAVWVPTRRELLKSGVLTR